MGWPFGEEVIRLTPQLVTDPYSAAATAPAWDDAGHPPAELPIGGVGVEPRPSTEDEGEARNSVTTGFTLYLPAGSPLVTSGHRVRVRGEEFSVIGDPAEWRSPLTGWAPGSVVQCARVVG